MYSNSVALFETKSINNIIKYQFKVLSTSFYFIHKKCQIHCKIQISSMKLDMNLVIEKIKINLRKSKNLCIDLRLYRNIIADVEYFPLPKVISKQSNQYLWLFIWQWIISHIQELNFKRHDYL